MASSTVTTTCSWSSGQLINHNYCGSDHDQEADLQQIMDSRKRKRMISNRESARRSRVKKQKHLDDLMIQVNHIASENNQILTSMNLTSQLFLNVEAENSVLRAQVCELTHRLQSLNEIINYMNDTNSASVYENPHDVDPSMNYNVIGDDNFLKPWSLLYVNQPIMTSADDAFIY